MLLAIAPPRFGFYGEYMRGYERGRKRLYQKII